MLYKLVAHNLVIHCYTPDDAMLVLSDFVSKQTNRDLTIQESVQETLKHFSNRIVVHIIIILVPNSTAKFRTGVANNENPLNKQLLFALM